MLSPRSRASGLVVYSKLPASGLIFRLLPSGLSFQKPSPCLVCTESPAESWGQCDRERKGEASTKPYGEVCNSGTFFFYKKMHPHISHLCISFTQLQFDLKQSPVDLSPLEEKLPSSMWVSENEQVTGKASGDTGVRWPW